MFHGGGWTGTCWLSGLFRCSGGYGKGNLSGDEKLCAQRIAQHVIPSVERTEQSHESCHLGGASLAVRLAIGVHTDRVRAKVEMIIVAVAVGDLVGRGVGVLLGEIRVGDGPGV